MTIKEISINRSATLKPSIELKRALDEAQACKEVLLEGRFMDWQNSLNESYLNSQGKVTLPESVIWTDLDDKDLSSNLHGFELTQPSGGVLSVLKWGVDLDKGLGNSVSIGFFKNSDNNLFRLVLTGEILEKKSERLYYGKYLQRTFFLNPESDMVEYVDSVLLMFTEELLEAGVL